jgi:hypothetical protein
VTQWRAVRVQTVNVQGFGHAEPIEHSADAVDAEAPEGTFAVLADELLKSAQLMRSSRVEVEFATLPARPGIGCDPEKLGRFGVCPVAKCTS